MTKVLIVSKFMHHVGGVETYIDWQARKLPTRGIECGFFGMDPPAGEKPMDSVRHRLYSSPNRSYSGSRAVVLRSAADAVYSVPVRRRFLSAVTQFKPDVIHFHGTCYQLTPSVAAATASLRIPAVVTAHEYKFICANQRMWNDHASEPCRACVSASSLERSSNILRKRCVKGSVGASLVAALEQPLSDRIWSALSPVVHAPSRFMAELLISSESAPGRVRYLDLPWAAPKWNSAGLERGEFRAAYFGRLAPEKGVETLLHAWKFVSSAVPNAQLSIFGDGGEEGRLRALAESLKIGNLKFHGRYSVEDLPSLMRQIDVTVHPSVWAENSPYTVRESLQFGIPAIVSDQGGLPEMVTGASGTVFVAGDARGLSSAILEEFSSRRAGSTDLFNAVKARAISDEQHLDGLIGLYELARSI